MNTVTQQKSPAETIKHWVELYSEALLSWAFHKTSDKVTAEDLVQDTFLSALQALPRFEGRSAPKTWLLSILNNKINDHFRKQFRNPVVPEAGMDDNLLDQYFDENERWREQAMPKNWDSRDEQLLDIPEFQQALRQCLEHLPARWLTAVQLKYLEAKDGNYISKMLEISPSNFWIIIHRAKLQLRSCLETNWFKK